MPLQLLHSTDHDKAMDSRTRSFIPMYLPLWLSIAHNKSIGSFVRYASACPSRKARKRLSPGVFIKDFWKHFNARSVF
ncbi:hypothetical protein XENTR_v10016898 [Xenopus tropicalis]|nr:hypothetical protein XENTR_v10016898 [Xenopus tropicalis]